MGIVTNILLVCCTFNIIFLSYALETIQLQLQYCKHNIIYGLYFLFDSIRFLNTQRRKI